MKTINRKRVSSSSSSSLGRFQRNGSCLNFSSIGFECSFHSYASINPPLLVEVSEIPTKHHLYSLLPLHNFYLLGSIDFAIL